jgi:hypothetical protein
MNGAPTSESQVPKPSGSTVGRLRKWALGVGVAAVTAVVVQALTGAFTTLGSNLWALVTGQEPIEVTVLSDPLSFARDPLVGDPEYVIPRPHDEIPIPPADPEARDKWASGLGGVDATWTDVQVAVTGRSSEPVILTNLRIRVLERRPPLEGTHVIYGEIGDAVYARWVEVTLDESPPVITDSVDYREGYAGQPRSDLPQGQKVDRDPVVFPYRVSATEPEVFYIRAIARKCDCSWVAELFWTAGGEQGSTIIDDDGRPFRTTSCASAPAYASLDGEPLQKVPRYC